MSDFIEQGTQEWLDLRMGKFTGSQMYRLLTFPRSKADKEAGVWSETAKTYITECVAEVLTGERIGEFTSGSTDWGKTNEDRAMMKYELETGNIISDCGYMPINDECGASPDGIVTEGGKKGVIEIKSPDNPAMHLKYFLLESLVEWEGFECRFHLTDLEEFKKAAKDYYWQVQTEILAAKAEWCDFISFRPDMPMKSQMIIIRIQKNEIDQGLILEQVTKAAELKYALIDKFTL